MANRVTIVDVAERAGVAISSVSSALNNRPGVSESTRKRILETAAELKFVPSLRGKSLSAKRAFAVGFVVHRDPTVLESDPFFASFIGGLESVLDSRGYALVLQMRSDAGNAVERYRKLSADRRVDGVFLSEIEIDDPRIELLQELQLPAVAINPDRGPFPFPAVRQDHREGIAHLVRHLTDAGHERIAYVSGPLNFIHSRQRLEAWRESVLDRGLRPGPTFEGDFTFDGGLRAADTLLSHKVRPTAVMFGNDLMAVGFMTRAAALGFDIPADVSVAGYDGIQLGEYIRPSLTTLRTSPHLVGAEAARLLVDAIEGKPGDDVDVPAAELVIRHSTGPAAV